jgi:hypothetical protein
VAENFMPSPVAAGLARLMLHREVVASVSLSHHQPCTCEVCKAAQGDDEAFARVVDRLEKGPRR